MCIQHTGGYDCHSQTNLRCIVFLVDELGCSCYLTCSWQIL